MIISSASYRHLASRTPATIQGGRAQYLNVGEAAAVEARLSAHVFSDESTKAFDTAVQTGVIDLDLSAALGGSAPATTRNLLARYLVVREGEEFEFSAQATSVLFYVVKGSGRSFQEDEVIEWKTGDAFLFSGSEPILCEAPAVDAVLFVVTDEPFVLMTGCSMPSFEESPVKPTHFEARTVEARLQDLQAQPENMSAQQEDPAAQSERPAAQEILIFASSGFERIGCVAPIMSAGIAALAPGTEQRPHCHDADTISLCLECEGVYSVIEGQRIDWIPNTAILTPAGAAHSQHSSGEGRMFSFFVQDRGSRPIRTWEPGQRDHPE